MQQQRGFTATDWLIIVTVLGMAAAIAVPRYVAINRDARVSAVESLAVSVQSSAKLSNQLWRAGGFPTSVTIDGNGVDLRNGYPTRDSIRHIIVDRSEFQFSNGMWTHKEKLDNPGCAVFYTPPSGLSDDIQVTTYTSGC